METFEKTSLPSVKQPFLFPFLGTLTQGSFNLPNHLVRVGVEKADLCAIGSQHGKGGATLTQLAGSMAEFKIAHGHCVPSFVPDTFEFIA